MKVSFDRQTLLGAVSAAAGISQTKNTFTAADGLLFECPPNPKFGDYDTDRDDLCRISAFDLEKGLRAAIPCTVIEKGMAVLNTVKILQIVRALPDGEITVDVNERGRAVISGGAFRFEITAAPGTDFPSMPMFVGDKIWQIPQRTLKFLLTKTVYAVGQNDSRAALNGALLSIRDGTLTVVGSDGFRIATAKAALPVSDSPIPDAQLLIPGRFLGELLHLLRDSDDTLPMLLGRKHVIFTVDNLRFFTRLIDTEYIPYEQFMLVSPKTEVFVSRSLLRDAVESVSVVTEDKLGGSGRSHIKLDIISTGVALSSVSSGGSVSGTVPADVSGQDITIAFTCRYLLDALRAVPEDCDTLKIVLNSPGTGILITPAHSDSFTDFILPYRIGK